MSNVERVSETIYREITYKANIDKGDPDWIMVKNVLTSIGDGRAMDFYSFMLAEADGKRITRSMFKKLAERYKSVESEKFWSDADEKSGTLGAKLESVGRILYDMGREKAMSVAASENFWKSLKNGGTGKPAFDPDEMEVLSDLGYENAADYAMRVWKRDISSVQLRRTVLLPLFKNLMVKKTFSDHNIKRIAAKDGEASERVAALLENAFSKF